MALEDIKARIDAHLDSSKVGIRREATADQETEYVDPKRLLEARASIEAQDRATSTSRIRVARMKFKDAI